MKPLWLLPLVLVALPAAAQDFTDADVERYIAVIAANGCAMTEDQAEELIPAAGFTRDLSIAIATTLLEDGRARSDEDQRILVLSPGVCK